MPRIQKKTKEDIIKLFKLSTQDSTARYELIHLGLEACEILKHDAASTNGFGSEIMEHSMISSLMDSCSYLNLEAAIYGITAAHELLSQEQKSVQPFQPFGDQQVLDNNFIQYNLAGGSLRDEGIDSFFKYNLGLAILISILLKPFVGENKEKRKKAIENVLSGTYIGTKIIERITVGIPKNFYPDFVFKIDSNDIMSLILSITTKDEADDFCHILDSTNKNGIESLKITPDNLNNIKNFLKVSKKNFSQTQKDFLKDVIVARAAVIAGVLSAGRGKISGIKTLENVQETTGKILSVRASSSGMMKKYCFEKNYSETGVKVRTFTEKIMKRMFDKLGDDVALVTPSEIECLMTAFLGIWNQDCVWTGSKLPDEIPQLRSV